MATPRKKKTTKKTTKKKAVAKKKTTTAKKTTAGARRPNMKIDNAANRRITERKTLYYKFPEGNTVLAVCPPLDGSGLIFTKTHLHYTLQRDDDPNKKFAPACLRFHGDGNCYICTFIDHLLTTYDDPIITEIAADLDVGNGSTHIQAFIRDGDEWIGPKLISLSPGLVSKFRNFLSMDEDMQRPPFASHEGGQTVMVSRTGTTKYNTRYDAQLTGQFHNLDDLIPDWYSRAHKDVLAKLDIKVLDIDEQKAALYRTFPDLPWKDIEDAIG